MNKIKMTPYTLVSLIFTILSISILQAAPSLIIGTIQFSKDSTILPININCGGAQITTSMHTTTHSKITFEIPKGTDQYHFDILITAEKITYQPKKTPDGTVIANTIDYLKINPEKSYLLYELDFIGNEWVITEKRVPESGRIPDKTIIIECYPEWVQDFKGGSIVELPTLSLNNSLMDLGKSEQDFEEEMIRLELTALDSKIINAPMKRQTLTMEDKKRILIIDSLT